MGSNSTQPMAGEVDFHPGMGIGLHHHEAVVLVIVAAGGKPGHQAGGDAGGAHHHGHAGGKVVTIALLQVEQEIIRHITVVGRTGHLQRVGELAQVILDGHDLVVGGGLVDGETDGQVTHPLGQLIRQAQIVLDGRRDNLFPALRNWPAVTNGMRESAVKVLDWCGRRSGRRWRARQPRRAGRCSTGRRPRRWPHPSAGGACTCWTTSWYVIRQRLSESGMVGAVGSQRLGAGGVGDPDVPIVGIVGLGTPVITHFRRGRRWCASATSTGGGGW